MKKIYSFIALMLMCFVGTANAQEGPMNWECSETSVSVEEFQTGEKHYYVLQEGSNLNENGEQGGHSNGGFLSCLGGCTAEVTTDNVFEFIPTGDKKEEFPIYVLKSVANGNYLAQGGSYVKYTAEAFKFTVRKGEYFDESNLSNDLTWLEYSNAVSSTRSVNAVEEGAWVLCSPESRTYIAFYGDPGFQPYIDTNNWYIKSATPSEMPVKDQFEALFYKYFENFGVKDDIITTYPVGKNPGYVTQELQDSLATIFDAAFNMMVNGADDDQYKAMIQRIENLFGEQFQKGLIQVGPGYFVLRNVSDQKRGFLTVTADGKKGRGNASFATSNVVEGTDYTTWAPEKKTAWSLSDARHIWKVENGTKEGELLFKNFATNTYLTSNDGFPMAEEGTPFVSKNYQGQEFYLEYGNGGVLHMQNHGDHLLMNYPHPEDAGSRFVYYTIGQDVIDSLTSKVAQKALNDELQAAVKDAKSDYYSLQYANYIEDNMYMAGDSGLVTSVFEFNSNATQNGDNGGVTALFDGNLKTFYHTAWNEGDVTAQGTEGKHWIKVDLGKEVSNLKIKMSKRQGAANGHIAKYALFALENAEVNPKALGDSICASVDSIEFQYGNSTHIADYKFEKPVRYLRFEVQATTGSDSTTWNAMTAGTGPFWHMSELRFYDPQDIKKNPAYDAIPADVKEALMAVITKAEGELKDKMATKETIKELEAALKKYWECYPDASELKSSLESAAQMAENAYEDDGIGFYEVGATAALLEVVNGLQKEVEAKEAANAAFTLDELKANQEKLDQAVAAFNAKLQLPEVGKAYLMVSQSLAPANAEGVLPVQVGALIASVDANLGGSVVFRYNRTGDAAIDTRLNAFWVVEKVDNGLAFKNLGNGLYMDNVFAGLTEEEIENLELPNNQIGWSKTPKAFTLEQFTKEGQGSNGFFVMKLKNGQYMNFQQNGQVMVRYSDRNDNNAPFIFEEVDASLSFEGSYSLDVEPGKFQILSKPVAFESVMNRDGNCAYRVLGKKDNKIMLELIEDAIPAGTPFIVKPNVADPENELPAEYTIQATLPEVYSSEDVLALNYVYDPVVVRGLVSTPTSEKLAAGYGVLVGNKVIPSEEGRAAVAGSGVFNKDIPETDTDADFYIEMEGEITAGGNATAVEEVVIVKNVPADVYTLSGVKVRQNVKMSNATQGLPKGVYIVGGKKVIVK